MKAFIYLEGCSRLLYTLLMKLCITSTINQITVRFLKCHKTIKNTNVIPPTQHDIFLFYKLLRVKSLLLCDKAIKMLTVTQ